MTLTYQQLAELMAKALKRVEGYTDLLPMSVGVDVRTSLVIWDEKVVEERTTHNPFYET